MTTQRYPVALLVVGVTVLAATFWWRKRRRDGPPKKWRHVGDLAEISLYPLKSGREIDLEEACCTPLGLRTTQDADGALHDRFLAVYNGNHREYSAPLVYPKLRLISVSSGGNGVVFLNAPGMPQLEVTLPENKDPIDCNFVFNHKVFLADCGDEAGQWVSHLLDRDDNQLRLGYHSPRHMTQRRKVNQKFWTAFQKHYTNLKEEYMGTFANLSSYLLLTRSSMDDLQKRLSQENLTIKRFRPNFVVSGCPPYDEDNWEWVRIGNHVIFQSFRVCARCSNTTIDPDTGVRDPKMEPLRTLKTYRKHDDPALRKLEDEGPRMGLNMGLYSGENYVVKVGDPVYVGEAE